MALFSSSKSTQTENITTNATDNRVAATDNGIAAGAGASVTINDISADVAKKALDANTQATQDALSGGSIIANAALLANKSVAEQSIAAQNAAVDQALNFAAVEGSGSRELALSALKTASGQKLPDALPQGGVQTLLTSSTGATSGNDAIIGVAKWLAVALGIGLAAFAIFKAKK